MGVTTFPTTQPLQHQFLAFRPGLPVKTRLGWAGSWKVFVKPSAQTFPWPPEITEVTAQCPPSSNSPALGSQHPHPAHRVPPAALRKTRDQLKSRAARSQRNGLHKHVLGWQGERESPKRQRQGKRERERSHRLFEASGDLWQSLG